MHQSELIQRVLAADAQAQSIAQDARQAQEVLESSIQAEIASMTASYEAKSQAQLSELQARESAICQQQLDLLEQKLQQKLRQVESLYAAKKDQWVDAIVERIVGKAGG